MRPASFGRPSRSKLQKAAGTHPATRDLNCSRRSVIASMKLPPSTTRTRIRRASCCARALLGQPMSRHQQISGCPVSCPRGNDRNGQSRQKQPEIVLNYNDLGAIIAFRQFGVGAGKHTLDCGSGVRVTPGTPIPHAPNQSLAVAAAFSACTAFSIRHDCRG